MNKVQLEAMKRIYGGPMTEREQQTLRDMQAFIEFCISNGLSFRTAVGTLAHDVNGILAPGDMFEKGIFTPKVTGYTRVLTEMSDDLAAIAAAPEMQPGHVDED